MNRTTTPRIYVASLSDYNAGTLHGVWIDVSLGIEHVGSEIKSMLGKSREPVAEEWAIHDYEGFAGLNLSEGQAIDDVCQVAALIAKHGPVFGGLVEYFGGLPHGLDEAKSAMEERYCGDFESLTDFAEHFVEEGYSVFVELLPKFIRYHIDYEGVARDMELGGFVVTIEHDGRLHVFWSR